MLKGKAFFAIPCLALFLFGIAGISWAAESLPPPFIAYSPKEMTYAQAEAFCKEKGGKLPRINNSDMWDGKNPLRAGVPIDGFGEGYGDWPAGLSNINIKRPYFWSGTKNANRPDFLYAISNSSNNVAIDDYIHRGELPVLCVSADTRGEAVPTQAAKGSFIAHSESGMNYADAVAFCKEKGGKLPRINNSNSWDGKDPPKKGIPIDGVGNQSIRGRRVGLPDARYWTDTAYPRTPGSWWTFDVGKGQSSIPLDSSLQIIDNIRAVCVPE